MLLSPSRGVTLPALVLGLLLSVAIPFASALGARDGDRAAPRSVVEIGGLSVVLIAAEGRLHAFVDRLADNAPALNADLLVATADGITVGLTQAAPGLFVGPFDPGERRRVPFVVSVSGADGIGHATAEIVYRPDPDPVVPAGTSDLRDKILIALVACATGFILGLLALRWLGVGRHLLRPI